MQNFVKPLLAGPAALVLVAAAPPQNAVITVANTAALRQLSTAAAGNFPP